MEPDCEEVTQFEVDMWGFCIRLQQQISDTNNVLSMANINIEKLEKMANKKIEQFEKTVTELKKKQTLSIDQVINILKALKTDIPSEIIKF